MYIEQRYEVVTHASLAGHQVSRAGNFCIELRRRLDSAVQAHNAAVGSLESRVLPAARRFKELGIVSGKEMLEPGPVDHQPRRLQAPETSSPQGAASVEAEIVSREPSS